MRDMTDDAYSALTEKLFTTYGPKIEGIMGRLVQALRDAGLAASEVYTLHDEEYTWGFDVRLFSEPDDEPHWGDLDVRFTIIESMARDGSKKGFSFMLDSCYWGGRCCGIGFAPANYTDELWLRKWSGDKSLKQRFELFEDIDLALFVQAVKDAKTHYEEIPRPA